MKGIVFAEFLEFVEEQFSPEMSDRLIETSDLPSQGVYTSVGTYPREEMVTLVTNLSSLVGVPAPDLLKAFGKHLFGQFLVKFPAFFEGVATSFEFLSHVENVVHLEVRKLYPDAELPSFSCTFPDDRRMEMIYESKSNLPDLAEGLILACLEHFGGGVKLSRKGDPQNPQRTIFTLLRED